MLEETLSDAPIHTYATHDVSRINSLAEIVEPLLLPVPISAYLLIILLNQIARIVSTQPYGLYTDYAYGIH